MSVERKIIGLGSGPKTPGSDTSYLAWSKANDNFAALTAYLDVLDAAIAELRTAINSGSGGSGAAPVQSVAGLVGTPDATALQQALGAVPALLAQQTAIPTANGAGGAVKLYARSGSGGAIIPEYKTGSSASQTVTLPGQFGGDAKSAWWTQPMGYGRSVTTGNDTPLVTIKSTLSSGGGTAGYGVPALQITSGIGSTAGSGTSTVITPTAAVNTAYSIVSMMNIYSSANNGMHCGIANEVRRKIPGASGGTIFACTDVLQDETGFASNISGPMNTAELDLIANGDDPPAGAGLGQRRILGLVYKSTRPSDSVGPVTITNGGSGYSASTPPSVTITDAGAGTGWTGICVVVGGAVRSVMQITPGTGYTGPLTVAIGAPPTGGTQATATATLAQPVEISYGVTLGPSSATQGTGAKMKVGYNVSGPVSLAAFDVIGSGQATASSASFLGSGVAVRMGVTNGAAPAGHAIGMTDGTAIALIGGLGTGDGNVHIALDPAGNGSVQCLGPVKLPGYAFAGLPSAATFAGCTVRVTDRNGRLATSDGTNWRFADGSVAS